MAGFCNVIHLVWYQGFDAAPADIRPAPERWARENPDHEVRTWDAHSMERLIRGDYPALLPVWHSLDRIIKRCDLARLLIVHRHGGVYADADLIPRRSLTSFYRDRRVHFLSDAPVTGELPASSSPVDVHIADRLFLLSKEYNKIDHAGYGVANGFIASRPGLPLWMDFVRAHAFNTNARVLDYLGPHALTRFLRQRASELRGQGLLLPPYYFLWERHAFTHQPPEWCVCEHPAVNRWGDASRTEWWAV